MDRTSQRATESESATPHEHLVVPVLTALSALMTTAGPVIDATSLSGLPAPRRAIIGLARLRERCVTPETLLATYLAVNALWAEDPTKDQSEAYRLTQIAKALHRLASGTHRVWKRNGIIVACIEKYPESRGAVLRHLGRRIDETAGIIGEEAVSEVLAIKVARYGTHPQVTNAQESTPEGRSREGQHGLRTAFKAISAIRERHKRTITVFLATAMSDAFGPDGLRAAGFGAKVEGRGIEVSGGGVAERRDIAVAEALTILAETFPDNVLSVHLTERSFPFRERAGHLFAGALRRNHIARLRKRFQAVRQRIRLRDHRLSRTAQRGFARATTLATQALRSAEATPYHRRGLMVMAGEGATSAAPSTASEVTGSLPDTNARPLP